MGDDDFSQQCCRAATNRKRPSKSLRLGRRGATCSSIFVSSSPTSGRQVRTKGHLFKTRDNALHHLFCAPDVQFNVHFARHAD